jgi:hypothetical protein
MAGWAGFPKRRGGRMKVLETTAIQVRIFTKDTIPYHILLRPDRVKLLQDHFAFQNCEIPFPISQQGVPRILNFMSGEFELNGKSVIIDRLAFQDRKVMIGIKGTSEELNSIFAALSSFVGDILGENIFDDSKLILKTDQTECVVQLDIDFMSVFSLKFRKFLKKNIPSKMLHKVEIIIPRHLTVELSFEQPIQYRSHNLSLSVKKFTVEPRANTSLKDQVFFTASPCPSDVHLELLREFEDAFAA